MPPQKFTAFIKCTISNLKTQTTATEQVCNVKRHDQQMICRKNCCGNTSISSARNNKNSIFKHFLSGLKSSHQPKPRGQSLPCNIKYQCHLVLPINISCVSALATGCVTEPSQSIYSLMPNAVLASKSKYIPLDFFFKYIKLPGVIIGA